MGAEEPIVIDKMRFMDLDEVLAIERVSFSAPWSRFSFISELIENDRAHYLVARCGGRVVGYIGVWLIVDEGHITNVAVHPRYRRRGIATRLLKAITNLVRLHGGCRLTLEVRVSNIAAQRVYLRLGFVRAGIRPRYYRDNNEDAVIMWKEIDEGVSDEERIGSWHRNQL